MEDTNVKDVSSVSESDVKDTDTGEKVGALQKFINSLWGGKDTEEDEKKAEESKENDEGDGGQKKEESYSKTELEAAIEEARKKWEFEKEEAERVKSLSPEEAAKEEEKKKESRIAELEKELLRKDLQTAAVKELEKEGYPVGLSSLFDYSSKEAMEKTMRDVKEIFKGSLEQAVRMRLRGKTPEGLGNAANAENELKDQIAKSIRGN